MQAIAREPKVKKRIRWTVEEYFRMSEAGVLDDHRAELLDGEILEVLAQANPHRLAISKINQALIKHFPLSSHWLVIQGTLILSKYSAPDPDFHIFDVPAGTPDGKLPLPFLVIEVSDTTYRKDSGPKLRAYAASGIADYWIVNIQAQRVEVYRSPKNSTGKKSGWQYEHQQQFTRGGNIAMLARPDIVLPVEALLP